MWRARRRQHAMLPAAVPPPPRRRGSITCPCQRAPPHPPRTEQEVPRARGGESPEHFRPGISAAAAAAPRRHLRTRVARCVRRHGCKAPLPRGSRGMKARAARAGTTPCPRCSRPARKFPTGRPPVGAMRWTAPVEVTASVRNPSPPRPAPPPQLRSAASPPADFRRPRPPVRRRPPVDGRHVAQVCLADLGRHVLLVRQLEELREEVQEVLWTGTDRRTR